MKGHKKTLLALALVLAAGFTGAHWLQAGEEKDGQAAADTKPLDYLGSTKVLRVDPVRQMFSHRTHVVQNKIACSHCHTDIFEKKWGAARATGNFTHEKAFDKGLYCGTCHNGQVAFATVGAENCVRCHGSNMVAPEVVDFQKPVRTVRFTHKDHVEMGFGCTECHPQLFATRIGAAEEKPEQFTMQALYDGKYCGACHDGETAFAANTRCTTCHIGVLGEERSRTAGAARERNKH